MGKLTYINEKVFQGEERPDNQQERLLRPYFLDKLDENLFILLKTIGHDIVDSLYEYEKTYPKIVGTKAMKIFSGILIDHYKIRYGLFYLNAKPSKITTQEAVEFANSRYCYDEAVKTFKLLYSLQELIQIALQSQNGDYDNLEISEIIKQAENKLDITTIQSLKFFTSFVQIYKSM